MTSYIKDEWEVDEVGNIWDKTGDQPEWKGFKQPDGTIYTERGDWINPETGEVDSPPPSVRGNPTIVKGPERKKDEELHSSDLFSGDGEWGYGAGSRGSSTPSKGDVKTGSHSSSVGGAMADRYTPKPKPKYGGYNYGGYGNYGDGGYGGYNKYGGHKNNAGYGGSAGKPASTQSYTSTTTTHSTNARKANVEKLRVMTDDLWMENVDTFADASEEDVGHVAEVLSKDVSELFDACGMVWGSDGGVELRNFMKKWLTENVKITSS
jgi:hypothetical protein